MGLLKRRAKAAAKRASKRWCPECQKNQPPFHTCVIKTDFRRRKTAAKRETGQRRKRPARPPHPYQACRDEECRRAACVAFREGYEAGIQNCPLPHAG